MSIVTKVLPEGQGVFDPLSSTFEQDGVEQVNYLNTISAAINILVTEFNTVVGEINASQLDVTTKHDAIANMTTGFYKLISDMHTEIDTTLHPEVLAAFNEIFGVWYKAHADETALETYLTAQSITKTIGARYFDQAIDEVRVWNGTVWKSGGAIDAYNKTEVNSIIKLSKPITTVLFTKTTPTAFTIPIGTTTLYAKTVAVVTLDLNTHLVGSVKTAGTDYYVYSKADATFYLSADNTITADQLIGGFHYGLVGETEALTGNKTEADMVAIRGINAYSFWDLKFRPVANPEGMAFIGGKWYDIYLLNSEHITNGTSKAGATIAGGVADANGRAIPKIPLAYGGDNVLTYGKLTWFQLCEIAKSHSKQLIPYAEFPTIAYGVNEGKSSQTDLYEVVVGKIEHYSNLTSKYGIEQASGTQWVWGKDVFSDTTGTYVWQNVADGRGNIYSVGNNPKAVLLGGIRGNGVDAGSRASSWNNHVWGSSWNIGCRFACDHLELV